LLNFLFVGWANLSPLERKARRRACPPRPRNNKHSRCPTIESVGGHARCAGLAHPTANQRFSRIARTDGSSFLVQNIFHARLLGGGEAGHRG